MRHRLDGQVVLAAPLPTALLGGLLIAMVGLAVVFASLATYSRKEEVPGWIVPDAGLIRVTVLRQAEDLALAPSPRYSSCGGRDRRLAWPWWVRIA